MANETILRATQAMRGRPVTSEEAHESVSRLIARAHNGPGPKSTMSIPVSPFDDDVLLTDYLLELEAKLKAAEDDFNLVMQGLAAPFGECFTLPDGNCIGRGCMHDRDADKLKAAEDALRETEALRNLAWNQRFEAENERDALRDDSDALARAVLDILSAANWKHVGEVHSTDRRSDVEEFCKKIRDLAGEAHAQHVKARAALNAIAPQQAEGAGE